MHNDEPRGPARERPSTMRMVEDRWATFRHIAEGVAIVLTLIWGFYTFVYTEKIKPTFEPAVGTNDLTIDPGKPGARVRLVTFHMHFKNSGRIPIDVYGYSINAYGIRFGTVPRKPIISDKPANYSFDKTVQSATRQLISSYATLLAGARGGLPRRHILLQPGQTFDAPLTVAIPPHAFDSVEADDVVMMGPAVANGSIEIKLVRRADGSSYLSSLKVTHNSDNVEQQL